MNSSILRSIQQHSLMLACFAILTGLLIAVVNNATAEKIIEQQQEAERKALYQVLPQEKHNNDILNDRHLLSNTQNDFNDIDLLALKADRYAYIARLNDDVSGVILPVEAHDGYSGDILILVGINIDGSLSGVRILNHKETPGLGDKIDIRVSDWILTFNNHSLSKPKEPQWKVKKDGGEFDQFDPFV